MKLKLYPKELFFALLAVFLPISLVLENVYSVPIVGYSDEVMGLICLPFVLLYLFKSELDQKDLMLIITLLFLTVFTLIGNVFLRVVNNWFYILVDMVCLLKIFTPYIVYKQLALNDKRRSLLRYILPFGKLLIVFGAIFGVISQVIDIGMTAPDRRYGIKPYNFIFGGSGGGSRYGYMVACMLLLLLLTTNLSDKQRKAYTALSILSMLLITKGVVYIVLVVFIILMFFWNNKTSVKLTPAQIFFVGVGGIAVSSLQIRSYLMDQNSPRMTLIRYGFKTANRYFPLGAGFATYGSEMAKRYYSPLYSEYGFNNRWGLSKDYDFFLNDGYLSLVSGEFGYIGLLTFIGILALIFVSIYKMPYANNRTRALSIAIFIGLVASALGTGIIKSSGGVFVMAMLGTAVGYCEQNPDDVIPPPPKKYSFNFKL